MPEAWSKKDERQYRKIRDDAKKRGASAERAKEIAGRTVNETRRKEGRTPEKTTSGTGNPSRKLEDRTVKELQNRARELHIQGRSKMDKSELIRNIRSRA